MRFGTFGSLARLAEQSPGSDNRLARISLNGDECSR